MMTKFVTWSLNIDGATSSHCPTLLYLKEYRLITLVILVGSFAVADHRHPIDIVTSGINNFYADNGLSDVQSFLYFPADAAQMAAIVKHVFFECGLRFIFSTRSKVPWILKEDGKSRFFEGDYKFIPGKDEIIAEGKAGYVVSFGEMLYRSWDAVLRCREQGLDVGLVNKPSLNVVDEQVRFFFSLPCSIGFMS